MLQASVVWVLTRNLIYIVRHNIMIEECQPCWSVGYPERERISFKLLPPVSDKDSEGYDWIRAKASIQVGDFSGQTDLMLTLSDIRQFRDQAESLYRELKGYAEFTTIEGQVDFKIETDGLGHMEVRGFLRDDASFGNRLTFVIEFDQTFLEHTISEIDEALSQLELGGDA